MHIDVHAMDTFEKKANACQNDENCLISKSPVLEKAIWLAVKQF